MNRGHTLTQGFFLYYLPNFFMRWALCLTPKLTDSLKSPPLSFGVSPVSLPPPQQSLPNPPFHTGAGEPGSGPDPFMAGSLLTESSPQLLKRIPHSKVDIFK